MRKYDVPSARDLGGLPQHGLRSGKDCKRSFHDYEKGLAFLYNSRQRLPLPDSSALPSLRKQEISWFLRDEPIKLRSSINTFISG